MRCGAGVTGWPAIFCVMIELLTGSTAMTLKPGLLHQRHGDNPVDHEVRAARLGVKKLVEVLARRTRRLDAYKVSSPGRRGRRACWRVR
jgi:hypothetical protein